MIEEINYNNNVEAIDFKDVTPNTSGYNADYEFEMQGLAGQEPSENFQGVRDSLAQKQVDEDRQTDLLIAEQAVKNGNMSPKKLEAFLTYPYKANPNTSLENAAAVHQYEDGIMTNMDQAAIEYCDADGETEMQAKNTALLMKFYKDLHSYSDNTQGFLGDTADFVASAFVPGNVQIKHMAEYSPTLTKGTSNWTHHGLASNIRENLSNAFYNQTPEEFENTLNTIKAEIASHNPNRIMLDDFISAIEFGGSNVIDAGAALDAAQMSAGIATGATKIGKYAFKTFAKLFNKQKGKEIAKEIMQDGNNVQKLDAVLETAAKPVSQANPTTTFNSYASNDIADEVVALGKESIVTDTLEETEEKHLVEFLKDKAYKDFKLTKNEPVDATLNYSEFGDLSVTYTLGGTSGEGLTKKRANSIAKQFTDLGIDAQVHKTDGTGSYIKFTQAVDPNDANQFIHLVSRPVDWIPLDTSKGIAKVFQAPLAFLGRHFFNVASVPEVAHQKDIWSSRTYGKLLTKFSEFKKSYNALSKEERQILDDIALKGNNEDAWYTREALERFGCNENMIKAYNDYRSAEDLTYVMQNLASRKEAVQRGDRMWLSKYVGRETEVREDIIKRASIIDENNQPISRETLLANKDKFKLIQLDNSLNNTDATHLAISKSSKAADNDLPLFILPYKAGGRREYMEGTQFIRVLGDIRDYSGVSVGKRARTIATANNAKEAQAICDEINAVIKVLKEVGTSTKAYAKGQQMLDNLDLKYFRVTSWKQVMDLHKKGVLSKDGMAKFMLDGKEFIAKDVEGIVEGSDWSSEMAMMNSRFNTHRGNTLEDVFGNHTAIYSVDEMFTKAVRKAAALGARNDMMLWYKRNLSQFKEYIANYNEIEGLNAVSAIRNAVLKPRNVIGTSFDATQYRAAEKFLMHARTASNAKTVGEQAVQRAIDSLGYQFIKHDNIKLKKAGSAIYHFNPVMAAQHIVFNKAMGWLNAGQLPKQAQGITGVLAQEPTKGAQAIASLPILMTYLLTKTAKNEARLAKALGLDKDTTTRLLKFLKEAGTSESSGLLTGAEVLQQKVLNNGKNTMGMYRWLANHQYDFMRWGNAINYYTADITAFLAMPNRSFKEIAAYSDKLFVHMTRASIADIQTGLTAPITQWLSYPMRMFEMMFDRTMTKAEKMKFLGIQMAIYGPAGILGTSVGQAIYGWDEPDTKTKALISDGLAGLTSEITGIDLRDGPRVGDIPAKFAQLLNLSDGRVNIKQMAASLGLVDYVADMTSTMTDLVIRVPFTDYQFYEWAYSTAKKKDVASTFKNSTRALLALKYNKIITHNGIVLRDPSTAQVVSQLFGYKSEQEYHQRMMEVLMQKNSEAVRDAVDSMKGIFDRVEKYYLEDITKYKDDEHYLELLNEFDAEYKALYSGLEGKLGEGNQELLSFRDAVLKRAYGGIPDFADATVKKAMKKLNNSQKALIISIMERDK